MSDVRDKLVNMLLLGAAADRSLVFSVSAECKRVGEQLRRRSEEASCPVAEAEALRDLASILFDAGLALQAVDTRCNEVLERVGSSDKPVAKALRDFSLKVKRASRGKYAYMTPATPEDTPRGEGG